jgi:hypothetical protein
MEIFKIDQAIHDINYYSGGPDNLAASFTSEPMLVGLGMYCLARGIRGYILNTELGEILIDKLSPVMEKLWELSQPPNTVLNNSLF